MRMVKNKWYNKHMRKKTMRSGFTMVELSLSIVFIAILSLSVVFIMMDAISAYHRGLTLNQINTTGMELTDDMRASIQNSPAQSVVGKCESLYYGNSGLVDVCTKDKARNFVTVVRYANVISKEKKRTSPTQRIMEEDSVPVFGAFCTGSYTYIWNSGYYFSNQYIIGSGSVGKATLKYKKTGGGIDSANDIRLLKIKDEDRSVCVSATRGGSTGSGDRYSVRSDTYNIMTDISNVFDISGDNYNTVDEEPVELLSDKSNLAIYNLTSSAPAEGTVSNNLFYAVSFVLGTAQGGANVMSSGNYCEAPANYDNAALENFDYCAINKFNFAAEATGG